MGVHMGPPHMEFALITDA